MSEVRDLNIFVAHPADTKEEFLALEKAVHLCQESLALSKTGVTLHSYPGLVSGWKTEADLAFREPIRLRGNTPPASAPSISSAGQPRRTAEAAPPWFTSEPDPHAQLNVPWEIQLRNR